MPTPQKHQVDAALHHIKADSITIDEAMQPLSVCIARLERSVAMAVAAAAKCMDTDQMKAARLMEHASAQEQQLDWLLNYYEAIDFDEHATIAEAMVAYAVYLKRMDLQAPGIDASKEKRQDWEDAVAWVISDDEEAPLSLAKVAPAIRIETNTLRANLLREAGLPQVDSRVDGIVATPKSRAAIVRSSYRKRLERTPEHCDEIALAMRRAGMEALDVAVSSVTTTLRAFKAQISHVAQAATGMSTAWITRFVEAVYPTKAKRAHWKIAAGALLAAPLAVMASGPEKRDLRQSNEASSQVSLPSYVLQAASFLKAEKPAEVEVQACVAKLSELAPGGGDVFSQQQSIAQDIPLAKIMMASLQDAAQYDDSANRCNWHLTNHQIRTQNPGAEVPIGRDAQPVGVLFKEAAAKQAGRGMLCAIGLSDLAPKVLSLLRSRPLESEAQATQMASSVLQRDLTDAVSRAYRENPDALSTRVMMAQSNLGSVKPYTVITPGGTYAKQVAQSEGDKVIEIVPDRTSAMAERITGISELAIGGLKAWVTEPNGGGYVAKFDGTTYSLTKKGVPFFDASTLAGNNTRVSLNTSGSFASNSPALNGRTAQLEQLSVCALSMNNLALQLAPSLMRPSAVPRPSSLATQTLLKRTDMSTAIDQARAVIAGQPIQTDYSENGLRWRVGPYTFSKNGGASRSGVQVTLSGAVLFDDTHAGGRSYTLTSSNSDSNSTGYFFKK